MVCRPSRFVFAQGDQPFLCQGTGFAFEKGNVGDQAEGNEIEKIDTALRRCNFQIYDFRLVMLRLICRPHPRPPEFASGCSSGSILGSTLQPHLAGFAQIVMIGDDEVHAAGFGVVHGFVSGDAGVTGQDEFCAAVDDLGQFGDVDAVR